MTKDQKIEAVRAALIRNANERGLVYLEDLSVQAEINLLWHGATFRGLLQFIRLNEEAWGGRYRPSRKILGNPRAFRCSERETRWTPPTYFLWRETPGKPLIEVLFEDERSPDQ